MALVGALLVHLSLFTISTGMSVGPAQIKSVTWLSPVKKCELEVRGVGLTTQPLLKFTDGTCSGPGFRTNVTVLNSTYAVAQVSCDERTRVIYTCVSSSTLPNEVIKWVRLGEAATVHITDPTRRERRQLNRHELIHLYGLKVESAESNWNLGDDGIPELLLGSVAVIRLFGSGYRENTVFSLTHKAQNWGDHCDFPATDVQKIVGFSEGAVSVEVRIPLLSEPGSLFYFCSKQLSNKTGTDPSSIWMHLGSEPHQAIRSYKKFLPLYVSIIIIFVCLCFSALFSGLNLGLMSLDRTDLKIIMNTGNPRERKWAKIITPVRSHGNYLLCSILLGNVMVNSTFTILLDDLTSGIVAVVGSTVAIVIFGEITPQAVCSRHGLFVGAATIWVTKMVMAITFPLAFPISKILDWILGEEIGAVYSRERLKELVKVTTEFNDLKNDEVNIISGALELSQKIVRDVMTKIEDVYMLPIDAILDFETVSEIMQSGFSRVPVYEGSRTNVVSLLYIKDLALVDPDDNTPLKTHCEFYQNTCYFIFEDTTLDVLFKQLKDGIKGHMAFVHRVNSEGEGDPFYETVGLITLEDVIEELIQAEINDETDVYTDNKSKRRRKERKFKTDFTAFAEKSEIQKVQVSPQLTLAVYQFLSTSIDAFKPENISENVLRRLLMQDIFQHIKIRDKNKNLRDDPSLVIYEQGKPVDYFVLILEGRVEVTVGRENLIFESGPFTFFGSQALIQNVGVAESPTSGSQPNGSLQSVNIDSKLRTTFVPDYGVRAVTEVLYLKIKRSMYLAAKRATLMEKSKKEESSTDFDDEMNRLMNALGDDTRSTGSPEVTRTHSQHQSGKTSPQTLQNGPLASSEPLLPTGDPAHDETSKLLTTSSYPVS